MEGTLLQGGDGDLGAEIGKIVDERHAHRRVGLDERGQAAHFGPVTPEKSDRVGKADAGRILHQLGPTPGADQCDLIGAGSALHSQVRRGRIDGVASHDPIGRVFAPGNADQPGRLRPARRARGSGGSCHPTRR